MKIIRPTTSGTMTHYTHRQAREINPNILLAYYYYLKKNVKLSHGDNNKQKLYNITLIL